MELGQSLSLRSGMSIPNRICKSALSEQLSDRNQNPTQSLIRLYQRWAEGGAGLLITGNVMLSPKMIAEPKNIVLDENSNLDLFKEWAAVVKSSGSTCFMQLNHPGRQVPNFIAMTPKAPSAVAMEGSMRLGFNKPAELTEHEILDIIKRFAKSALLAKECGFDGVQIHGAHGYLINQFLSPAQNLRKDQWGGTAENRIRFTLEVYNAIREAVGKDFPIAIKLNSSDAATGGYSDEDAIVLAKRLDSAGIDFIEVSGGTYENQSMSADPSKLKADEGFFVPFAKKLKQSIEAPVMVTGGLRNPALMEKAVKQQDYDMVGMGRPFSLDPDVAKKILAGSSDDVVNTPYIKTNVKWLDKLLVINLTWYEQQLKLLSEGKSSRPSMSPWKSIVITVSAMGLKALLPRRA